MNFLFESGEANFRMRMGKLISMMILLKNFIRWRKKNQAIIYRILSFKNYESATLLISSPFWIFIRISTLEKWEERKSESKKKKISFHIISFDFFFHIIYLFILFHSDSSIIKMTINERNIIKNGRLCIELN